MNKKRTPARASAEVSLGIDLEFKARIPRSILAKLLDMAGKPEGISPRPLMGNPGELYSFQLAELYASDFIELPGGGSITLSPTFTKIAKVLLNPQTNLTFRIWGDLDMCAETNIQFPGHIIDGGGVVLNQVDTSYQMGAFVKDSYIMKLLWPLLPDEPTEKTDFQFEGHFYPTAVAVLFAFIDLARRLVRSKGSTTVKENDIVFSSLQVTEYLDNEWGLTGFEDLLTYVTTAIMKYEPPSLTEIAQGLETLVKANVLTQVSRGKFGLSPVLMPLVYLTVGDQAGLQWQRVTRLESNELLWSNRIFLFCGKSMVLQFSPTIENKVFISSVTREDVIKFLTEEFTLPPLIVSVKPAVPEVSVVPPSAPVAKAETMMKAEILCSDCGRKNSKEAVTCKFCGALLVSVTVKHSASVGTQQPPPAAVAASQIANVQGQLQALQQEMKSSKLELSKLEVRYKVGELSLEQYQNSVSTLQAKMKKLEQTAEELARQL